MHALRDLVRCTSLELSLATADSLLRVRPDLRRDWASRLDRFPSTIRARLECVDGICESGTETLFWLRIAPLVADVRRQVRVSGVGRVDFIIGHRLVVEIDGAEYHTDPAAFERDRHRDALLSRLGYRVLRFSYNQVMHHWPEVEGAVVAAVRRIDHL